MSLLRRIFLTHLFGASAIQAVLTAVGVFTFFAGMLYLPSLEPTRMESFLFMMLLAVIALLCATLGQLVVVAERLERSATKGGEPGVSGSLTRD